MYLLYHMWAYQCTAICQAFLGITLLQLKLVNFSEGYQVNKKLGDFNRISSTMGGYMQG